MSARANHHSVLSVVVTRDDASGKLQPQTVTDLGISIRWLNCLFLFLCLTVQVDRAAKPAPTIRRAVSVSQPAVGRGARRIGSAAVWLTAVKGLLDPISTGAPGDDSYHRRYRHLWDVSLLPTRRRDIVLRRDALLRLRHPR